MSKSVSELYEILERRDVGGMLVVLGLQLGAKLGDAETACVPRYGFQMGVSAVDHAVPGRCGDELRLVLGRTTGATNHLDGRKVEEVADEALKLGHDPEDERFVELLGPGLRRPADPGIRPCFANKRMRSPQLVDIGPAGSPPIYECWRLSVGLHSRK